MDPSEDLWLNNYFQNDGHELPTIVALNHIVHITFEFVNRVEQNLIFIAELIIYVYANMNSSSLKKLYNQYY